MVNIEYISGASTFTIDNITLVRNFHSYVHGNNVRIVNAYDTRNELLPYTPYSDISVNGQVYGSVVELAEVLAPVLFSKSGGSGGDVITTSGNIITRTVQVAMDWSQDPNDQIVDFVNGQEFSVTGSQRILFKATRITGDLEANNSAETYYWEFKPGKGTYGVNGTAITVNDIEYISFVTNLQNNIINLGEIGTTPIEIYVNETGPYVISKSTLNIFKSTRNGTAQNYLYIGNANAIGIGETQSTEEDYIDVNAEPVEDPQGLDGVGLEFQWDGTRLGVKREDDVEFVYQDLAANVDGVTEEYVQTEIEKALTGQSDQPNYIITFVYGYDGGLNYEPYAKWYFEGEAEAFEATANITLTAADATYDRIDLFVLNSNGTISIVEGTPAENPVEPEIDHNTQLIAGRAIIPAGATTPKDVNFETIYSEGGAESWNITPDTDFDTQNPDDPNSGTYAIKTVNPLADGKSLSFSHEGFPMEDGTEFQYALKLINGANHRILIQGEKSNGRTHSFWMDPPANFDPEDTSSYQNLVLGISGNQLVNITRIDLISFSENMEYYLDDVHLVYGTEGFSEEYATVDYVNQKADETLQAAKDYHEQNSGDGSGTSNIAAGPFGGVFESTGGNAFYDDYTSGSVVNLSLGANPVLGETWTVRIKGDLTGTVPAEWNFSGQPITSNSAKLNELTLLYVIESDVRIVNRVVNYIAPAGQLEPEYQAWLDYGSTNGYDSPSEDQNLIFNNRVKYLKAINAFDRLDTIRFYDATYTPSSWATNILRVNIKSPGSNTLTANSGLEPSFVNGSGFFVTGGSGKFAKDGFNPGTSGLNYKYNSASEIFGTFGIPATLTADVWMLGGRTGNDTTQTLIGRTTSQFFGRMASSDGQFDIAQSDLNGHYHIARGSVTKAYLNDIEKTALATFTYGSSISSIEHYELGANNNGVLLGAGNDLGFKYHLRGNNLSDLRTDIYNILNDTYTP